MSLFRFIWIGCTRSPVRFALSILGVATAVWGLSLVRTASDLWRRAIDSAADDTLIVRSALPQRTPLPLAYVAVIEKAESEIEQLALRYEIDVLQTDARPRRMLVETTVAESEHPLSELRLSERLRVHYGLDASKDLFLRAKGDDARLVARMWIDPSSALLVPRAPGIAFGKTTCDELRIKLRSRSLADIVSKRIDALFESERVPTITQTEHAMQREMSRSLGSLFRLIDGLSLVLLSIIAVVIAAMIALATTERTTEYAVLRALGFRPTQILVIVCSEAVMTAAFGAAVGVLCALASSGVLSRALLRAMPELVFDASLSPSALALGFVAACALALLASIAPAFTAAKIVAAEALRKQG